MKIRDYAIPDDKRFSLHMPEGAEIIEVLAKTCNYYAPVIVAMVDDNKPCEKRNFIKVSIDEEIPFFSDRLKRINGTYLTDDYYFLFEIIEDQMKGK